MNKYKQLIQKLMRQAVITGITCAIAVGLYFGVSQMEKSAAESQKSAEAKLAKDKELLNSLNNQMSKSGDAEKQFLVLLERRSGDAATQFSGTTDDFKQYIVGAIGKHHLQISGSPQSEKEAPTDRPELVNLQGYNVTVRPKIKIVDMKAPTDVHVFSLIEDMRRAAPGLVRIDGLELKRNGELTDAVIEGLRTGTPGAALVQATIEMSLIGIRKKEEPKSDKANGAEAIKAK